MRHNLAQLKEGTSTVINVSCQTQRSWQKIIFLCDFSKKPFEMRSNLGGFTWAVVTENTPILFEKTEDKHFISSQHSFSNIRHACYTSFALFLLYVAD